MSRLSRASIRGGKHGSGKRRRKSKRVPAGAEAEEHEHRSGGWGRLPGLDWEKDSILRLDGFGPLDPAEWSIGPIEPMGALASGRPAGEEAHSGAPRRRGRSRATGPRTYGRRR
ncbi:hypothetical protein [Cohnella nanjingensis]|uniref:Uncharacterized protein n=1 Tax=Cohnella nanjingensis TaxID=1387779 RepID=A0A7X0RV81_9BACL|nr:hypothetical protein [Cohnella nanjingensis]MBB6674294.1 hypothetical protein [Cohnella nanjingensis]